MIMSLNSPLKVLLRSTKCDKWFFAIKWYSNNTKTDVKIKQYPTWKMYKKLIMDIMRLNNQQALEFLRANTYVFRIPPNQIIQINNFCQSLGVNMSHIHKGHLDLFSLEKSEIETRICILREIGVKNVAPVMLNDFIQNVNMKVFRVYAEINGNFDMSERLYSFLIEPPMPRLQNVDENLSIKRYRHQCLSHYYEWRLKIPPDEKLTIDTLANNTVCYDFTRLRQSFNILHEIVGIPIDEMRNPIYLKRCLPDDLISIIQRINTICNVPVIELIQSTPSLCAMNYGNVSMIKDILEKNGYSAEQLRNCPQILLSDSNEVMEILNITNQRADFQIFHKHPEILDVCLLEEEFKLRVGYLDYLNIQSASISMFKKSPIVFDNISKSGKFTFDIAEICWIVQKFLLINENDIIYLLKKHPFWNKRDLLNIYKTLDFLTIFFDKNAIKKNLTVILYPREKLEEVLVKMIHTYHLCSPENPYTTIQILALCEYEIEKKYHFTGDGVWEKSQRISDLSTSLSLETVLRNETSRRNFFKNNPNDYFWNNQYTGNSRAANGAYNYNYNYKEYYNYEYRNKDCSAKFQLNCTNKT